jgi:putative queuosine salvage protein
MGVLDEVRANAAAIASDSAFVAIADLDTIEDYARQLPIDQARAAELDPATHFLGEPSATLAYVVTLDAINFGSGYFPRLKKRPGLSGYFTVASSLKDRFEAEGPFSAAELRALTAAECARMFGQDMGRDEAVDELMGLFARALNDLGALVGQKFHGSFSALADAADHHAEALTTVLTEMPFYRDVGFYKRAQLTAADLVTAGVAHFDDLDRLTIFADNLVPHVLRVDGILRYDADLLARINREELIPAGSREEREIRGCALHAVECIRQALGNRVTSMQLDYLLWNRGQRPAYKAQPRHRTRTVFY